MKNEALNVASIALNFIKDGASNKDDFGPHQRLADAITNVICHNKDLKVIGLLGPWGSGKSTVVKLMEEKLGPVDSDNRTNLILTYDAWLHQSDPPRRAFLESLIAFLSQHGLEGENSWQEDLDRLNGKIIDTTTTSTPMLTSAGRAIFISLLLVPIGAVFTGHEWYHDYEWSPLISWSAAIYIASLLCVSSPALVALFLYIKWRPTWRPWKPIFWTKKNWTEHKDGRKEESILSLFMNRQITKNRSRVLRDPEPTAIEFQDIFRKIMKEAANHEKKPHFIFVIDNLDRLPGQDALAMWATIRSFFLGTDRTNNDSPIKNVPVILLPIDESAINIMFQGESDASSIAASFMAKTFDLTFRISKPVLSSWENYLTQQMKHVFAEHYKAEWAQITVRFYHRLESSIRDFMVTPRSINKLVNDLGTCWLQWQQGASISFPSIAYYCVFRSQIEKDIIGATSRPIAGIGDHDPNWARSIAALHFGVEPEEAQQVLIGQPLRNVIQGTGSRDEDLKEFSKLSLIRGFSLILNNIISSWREEDSNDPERILNVASLIYKSPFNSNPAVASIWRSLRLSLRETHSWKSFDHIQCDALIALTPSRGSADRKEFIEVIADRLRNLGEKAAGTSGFVKAFAQLWKSIGSESGDETDLPAQIIVPGPGGNFFAASDELETCHFVVERLKTACDNHQLIDLIANEVSQTASAEVTIRHFEQIKSKFKGAEIDAFMQTLGNLVRQAPAGAPSILAAAKILGSLRNWNANAVALTNALCNEGHIAQRLTFATQQKDSRLISVLLALLYLSESNFEIPEPETWESKLKDNPELIESISRDLTEFSTDKFPVVTRLVNAACGNPKLRPISSAVFSYRVNAKAMGAIPFPDVVQNIGQYSDTLDGPLKEEFIRVLGGYRPWLWDTMSKLALDGNVANIVSVLVKAPGEVGKSAGNWLDVTLGALSSDQWKVAIQRATSPYILCVERHAISGLPIECSALLKAMNELISELLTTGEASLRTRWFELARALDRSETITLYRYMADQICSGAQVVANMSQLIAVGAKDFLVEGDFVDSPDKAVRHVILPMLSDQGGVEALQEYVDTMSTWVEKSDTNTRDVLGKRLEDAFSSASNIDKKKFRELSRALSISLNTNEGEGGTD